MSVPISLPISSILGSLNGVGLSQEQPELWTDDLMCPLSGVGLSTNQIYRENGLRREGHECEDRSFHYRQDGDVYLYGIFDGHSGSKVAAFVAQKMPEEILLGQLHGKVTDDEIKDVLKQAFIAIEKGYFELINDSLAEKYNLMMQIPADITAEQFPHRCPEICSRLRKIDAEIAGGTAALVALIVNNHLYVANVGCCRGLLCRRGTEDELRVVQLTSEHNLDNGDELERLSELGIDVEKLRQTGTLAGHYYTRSIGDYHIKNDFCDIDMISSATSSPLLAVPEVFGGFELDSSCCFLALLSDGMYRTVQDVIGSDRPVNSEIASIIVTQFSLQSTYHGVAQAAVDHVVRQHHSAYESAPDSQSRQIYRTHDDITLVLRGINFPFASSVVSPTSGIPLHHSTAGLPQMMAPLSITIPPPGPASEDSPPRPFFPQPTHHPVMTGGSVLIDDDNESPSSSTFEADSGSIEVNLKAAAAMKVDESGRIAAYVDFSEFEAALAAMSVSEREALEAELEPRRDFETITEERETPGVSSPTSAPSLIVQ